MGYFTVFDSGYRCVSVWWLQVIVTVCVCGSVCIWLWLLYLCVTCMCDSGWLSVLMSVSRSVRVCINSCVAVWYVSLHACWTACVWVCDLVTGLLSPDCVHGSIRNCVNTALNAMSGSLHFWAYTWLCACNVWNGNCVLMSLCVRYVSPHGSVIVYGH